MNMNNIKTSKRNIFSQYVRLTLTSADVLLQLLLLLLLLLLLDIRYIDRFQIERRLRNGGQIQGTRRWNCIQLHGDVRRWRQRMRMLLLLLLLLMLQLLLQLMLLLLLLVELLLHLLLMVLLLQMLLELLMLVLLLLLECDSSSGRHERRRSAKVLRMVLHMHHGRRSTGERIQMLRELHVLLHVMLIHRMELHWTHLLGERIHVAAAGG